MTHNPIVKDSLLKAMQFSATVTLLYCSSVAVVGAIVDDLE